MADPFARMSDRLLAHLGGEAVLRGTVNCRAAIMHGVAVTGEYGEITALRSVATIGKSAAAKAGDTLLVDGVTWTIDALESDDGYTSNFWLR